jgi:hypothetical protein
MNPPYNPMNPRPHVPPIPEDLTATVDAALCMWEYIDSLPDGSPWDKYRACHGTVSARYWCIGNAHVVENLWLDHGNEFDAPFDWEFVPLVMDSCIVWTQGSYDPSFHPDSSAIIRGLLALAYP